MRKPLDTLGFNHIRIRHYWRLIPTPPPPNPVCPLSPDCHLTRHSHNVHVPLVVLTPPATSHALIPPALHTHQQHQNNSTRPELPQPHPHPCQDRVW